MITVKQYELHESVKALERAPLRLEILTRRVELNGEEINARFAWQERANCRGADPNLFFPGQGASTREAKAMCAACEVKDDCLEFAITEGERFGLWGGLSERERRKIRGQRTRAKALQVPWLVGRKSD
jgi:WhiB family redox-sensing transcriptional regulator